MIILCSCRSLISFLELDTTFRLSLKLVGTQTISQQPRWWNGTGHSRSHAISGFVASSQVAARDRQIYQLIIFPLTNFPSFPLEERNNGHQQLQHVSYASRVVIGKSNNFLLSVKRFFFLFSSRALRRWQNMISERPHTFDIFQKVHEGLQTQYILRFSSS